MRRAAQERRQEQFTCLLHHLTIHLPLRVLAQESYYALKRNAAPGVDGVRWRVYEEGLEIGSPICAVGSTMERTGPNRRGECT
ncbi:MAG: hypothetical protein ACKV22_30930 [Bryobacteraceae bacterium]